MASLECLGACQNVEKEALKDKLSTSRRSISIACQANLDDKQDSLSEHSDVNSEGEGEEGEEESSGSGKSYDSDDYALNHNFSLCDKELKDNLLKLHIGKGNLYHTCTSAWRKKSRASAVYKLFKIKRWQLTDVNFVFDPLISGNSFLAKKGELLWPNHSVLSNADINEVYIKATSVDGILASNKHVIQHLIQLDALLTDIDGSMNLLDAKLDKHMYDILERMVGRATKLPEPARKPFYKFVFGFLNAIFRTECKEKVLEVTFENLFQRFVCCISACLNEDAIDCSRTMDGVTLDQLLLRNGSKTFTISSIPDLFIFQTTRSYISKRAIAVVEVKGKHGERILHSDDEDEPGKESPELGMIEEEEESEEELPMIEKIAKRKHKRMKKLSPQWRRRVGKFLPQLIGEMLCCNGCRETVNIKRRNPGFSFGIAVVGFDVYFVTLVASKASEDVRDAFQNPDVYYNVFITRPFDIRVKTDRRIVIKVLAAGFYVQETPSFPSSHAVDNLSSELAKSHIE